MGNVNSPNHDVQVPGQPLQNIIPAFISPFQFPVPFPRSMNFVLGKKSTCTSSNLNEFSTVVPEVSSFVGRLEKELGITNANPLIQEHTSMGLVKSCQESNP